MKQQEIEIDMERLRDDIRDDEDRCPHCEGSGDVWFSIAGEFIGAHHMDDLDHLETCPICDGSGYI